MESLAEACIDYNSYRGIRARDICISFRVSLYTFRRPKTLYSWAISTRYNYFFNHHNYFFNHHTTTFLIITTTIDEIVDV